MSNHTKLGSLVAFGDWSVVDKEASDELPSWPLLSYSLEGLLEGFCCNVAVNACTAPVSCWIDLLRRVICACSLSCCMN